MKKRLIILLSSLILPLVFSFGFVVGTRHIFPYKQVKFLKMNFDSFFNKKEKSLQGRWSNIQGKRDSSKTQIDNIAQLSTLPYLSGYNRPKKDRVGVTVYNKKRSYPGLNLFCSGHAPKVYLMTMDGAIKHQWGIPFEEVWPGPLSFDTKDEHKEFIRRAHLFPNGDLLAIFEYIGIIKLDKDSNLLWSYLGQSHHDLDISRNGDIYTLGEKLLKLGDLKKTYPGNPYKRDILNDYIIILSSHGKEIRRISILDAFYRSRYASYLDFTEKKGRIFHANSICIIDKFVADQHSQFSEGDILVSLRNINTIVVIDAIKGTVKWILTGMWRRQHKAVFVKNGNILLLDNQGGNSDSFFEFNQSRVLEINPDTREIVWQFVGENNYTFYTRWLGYNQRLPNGNTLITESDQGHILEISPDNSIVWEYYTPKRAGKKNELIATIMSAIRVDFHDLSFINE
jgi:hypothetical protein